MSKKVKIMVFVLAAFCFAAFGTVVGLSIAFAKKDAFAKETTGRIDRIYEKSYYDTMNNMDDVEKKLGKVYALSSVSLQKSYLYEIWRQCSVSVSNLSQMAPDNEEIETVIKFLNQTGDYAYYLSRKGENLTADERETLAKLKNILSEINESLFALQEEFGTGERLETGVLSDMATVGGALKNRSGVDYPELIYDGPFSDGLLEKKTLFLSGKPDMSAEECSGRLASFFPEATDIRVVGENNSAISCYIFSFSVGDGEGVAQMSKKGGYLVEYACYGRVTDPQYTPDLCVTVGKRFLQNVGFPGMECVWVYNADSTVYLNFAASENNVVFYPDLIKVKVDGETGKVVGMESMNYIYNHTARTVGDKTASITVSPFLQVESERDCVIPTEWGEEVFCREVKGTLDGETYYVYYDYRDGEETEAFVVVDELLE